MPKEKPQKTGNKPGRPSKYDPKFCEQAKKLAKLGAIDREVADFFEVSESTINLWKIEHPEFSESLKVGKDDSNDRVKKSLFHRAVGYSHPAEKIFLTKEGEIVRAAYTEHYPPDATSCIFWLKNRDPDNWREQSGDDDNKPFELTFRVTGKGERIAKPKGEADE